MRRLRLSDQAKNDVLAVWEHIAVDKPVAADRLVQKLIVQCKSLAENPGIGKMRNELRSGLRSYPVGNYVILYHAIEDGIAIFRIVHGARDLEDLLERETEETFRFDDSESA
jgi:toxin ParE1/3/4